MDGIPDVTVRYGAWEVPGSHTASCILVECVGSEVDRWFGVFLLVIMDVTLCGDIIVGIRMPKHFLIVQISGMGLSK